MQPCREPRHLGRWPEDKPVAPEGVLGDTRVDTPTEDLCGATEENSNPRCRTRAVAGAQGR